MNPLADEVECAVIAQQIKRMRISGPDQIPQEHRQPDSLEAMTHRVARGSLASFLPPWAPELQRPLGGDDLHAEEGEVLPDAGLEPAPAPQDPMHEWHQPAADRRDVIWDGQIWYWNTDLGLYWTWSERRFWHPGPGFGYGVW